MNPSRISWSTLLAAVFLAGAPLHPASATPGQSLEEAKNHWAYQPLTRPDPPRVRAADRVQTPVDAFLLDRLERAGLEYSPPADRRTLLRRVYFDLIGLPPTYEEIQAFERDPDPTAFAKAVDRLLADPRYGERWGRHWLDVARYADTKDLVLLYGKDALRPFAYTYRDYVIRAFNEDLPFDEFVRDQLAADLTDVPRWRLAALGFLTLGRLFDNNRHDQIDDQIDTVTRGFLGLTVACARCHDHKYDAITMEDYYGLYGVFASTEVPYLPPLIEDPDQVDGGPEFEARLAGAVAALESHIDREYERLSRVLQERVGDYFVRAATTQPDITETTQFALSLTPDDFRPSLVMRTRRLLERRLNPSDRVFGLWSELLELPRDGFRERARERIAKARQEDRNAFVTDAFAEADPGSPEEVAHAFGRLLTEHRRRLESRPCGELAYLPTRDEEELSALIHGETSPVWFARRDTPDHMSRPEKDRYNSLVLELDKIAAYASNRPPARAMVVADLPRPYQPHVFARGNPSRPAHAVDRAFPAVLSGGAPAPLGEGSGRLELARRITAPENPLTARVLVNRVWMHHFGEPLVGSTTDFGTRSQPPRNPELLDWLASEFIGSGWSLKRLHRVIVLSAAYQQGASPGCEQARRVDPENTLLWKYPRRRLEFEAMRDSLLQVAGRLDPSMGGRPVDLREAEGRRRSVYGLVDRQNLPAVFRSFDFAVPDQCVERRPETTVPQQALFALNSPFVVEQARALAALPEISQVTPEEERVGALFRRVFGRAPTERERSASLHFLAEADRGAKLTPWEQLAQVLLISNEAVFID